MLNVKTCARHEYIKHLMETDHDKETNYTMGSNCTYVESVLLDEPIERTINRNTVHDSHHVDDRRELT